MKMLFGRERKKKRKNSLSLKSFPKRVRLPAGVENVRKKRYNFLEKILRAQTERTVLCVSGDGGNAVHFRKRRKKSFFRRLLTACLVFAVFVFCIVYAVGNFIYEFALVSDSIFSRNSIVSVMQGKAPALSKNLGTPASAGSSWLEQTGESVYITSQDGLRLHGYYVENAAAKNKYAVVCHGYASCAANASSFAERFYAMGYSVLCPDARAHGGSEGTACSMGYNEKNDLLLWLGSIAEKDPDAQIVLYGLSMGAATVMLATGEATLPENVVACIEDCGFTNVYDEISAQIEAMSPFPGFPLADCASFAAKLKAGFSFKEVSCTKAVSKSKTPTLFIHGTADTFVPYEMLDELYEAAGCEKEKLSVEGAGHYACAKTEPELYWSTVERFLLLH